MLKKKINHSDLIKVSKDYLRARKRFKKIADEHPSLRGNDNLIGRIGEFIAINFLKKILHKHNVHRNVHSNQAGFDLIAKNKRVSVKIITKENMSGKTTKIKDPWDELVLVELDDCRVHRIGYLLKKNLRKYTKSVNPVTRRSMLNQGGYITRYGKVYDSKDVKKCF